MRDALAAGTIHHHRDLAVAGEDDAVGGAGHAAKHRGRAIDRGVRRAHGGHQRMIGGNLGGRPVVDDLTIEVIRRELGFKGAHDRPDARYYVAVALAGQAANIEKGVADVGQAVDLAGVAAERGAGDGGGNVGLAQQGMHTVRALLVGLKLKHAREQAYHGGQRVYAFFGHGTVRDAAVRQQAQAQRALVCHTNLALLGLADNRARSAVGVAARNHMLDAKHHAFFVNWHQQADCAGKGRAGKLERARGKEHGRHATLHVGSAAPIHAPAHNLATEGIVRPGCGVARSDDVGMAFEDQRAG